MHKPIPLIFTHYGNSSYLSYTLRQAKYTNPDRELVLIGDDSNYDVAIQAGWKHYNLDDFQSSKRDEFNFHFRWVQGKDHDPIKGKKDWLRYVSERFFVIEKFIQERNIDYLWHFDSDTMILHELSDYETRILELGLDCTTQCNDSCLSGIISRKVIEDYCSCMIEDYKDEVFLASQQKEFDDINTGYAYTEMRAFKKYRSQLHPNTRHLASLFSSESIWFDDCICQDHGFSMAWAEKLEKSIKDFFSIKGDIVCRKYEGEKIFATINCSWVSRDVYQWIERVSRGEAEGQSERLVEYLSCTPGDRLKHALKRSAKFLLYKVKGILFAA